MERAEGRADVDLDEAGVRQAQATAARLQPVAVGGGLRQPLRRAMSTAGSWAQARPGRAARAGADRHRTTGSGRYDHPEARADDPKLYDLWLKRPQEVTFPGGEGLAQVRERAAAPSRRSSEARRKTILLVSHKLSPRCCCATSWAWTTPLLAVPAGFLRPDRRRGGRCRASSTCQRCLPPRIRGVAPGRQAYLPRGRRQAPSQIGAFTRRRPRRLLPSGGGRC